MRAIALLVTTILLASGCEDALGPAGGCSSEMREFRRTYGRPDTSQTDQNAGDYFETWTYLPAGTEPGLQVLFRWGVSIEGCVVDGPVSIDLVPVMPFVAPTPTPAPAAAVSPRPSAPRTA